MQVHSTLLRTLVREQPEVGGAVALQEAYAEVVLHFGAQGLRQHLRGDERDLDAERRSQLAPSLEQRVEEARRSQIRRGAYRHADAHLEVRLTDARRHHHAPHASCRVVEHEAERRQVVGGGIDDDVSGAEPRGAESHAKAPEVLARTLRVDDRSRRGEDPLQQRRLHREETAKRRVVRLQRGKIVLSRDRDLRQVVYRLDVAGRDSGLLERAAHVRRPCVRVSDRLAWDDAWRNPNSLASDRPGLKLRPYLSETVQRAALRPGRHRSLCHAWLVLQEPSRLRL